MEQPEGSLGCLKVLEFVGEKVPVAPADQQWRVVIDGGKISVTYIPLAVYYGIKGSVRYRFLCAWIHAAQLCQQCARASNGVLGNSYRRW